MIQNDKLQFEEILTGLAEIFDTELSDIKVDIYFEALKDMSLDDFRAAANTVARTCKFFPKPVEFREQVLIGLDVQASLAYEKVEKAFRKPGIYKTVVFDDPVIHAVIQNLGGDKGWIEYNNLLEKDVKWWRKDFEKKYLQLAPLVHQGSLDPPKELPGLYAFHDNATDEARLPVIIGDRQKALEWTGQKALTE